MKQVVIFSVAFIICNSFFSCNENKAPAAPTVNRFSWLAGNWVMKEKDGGASEQWQQVNDSLMTGISNFIKGDSVIPFETVKIYNRDTVFFYEVKAVGQNNELPIAFRITSLSDSAFVAENAQHDFPKRIGYRMINKDSVTAYIDGGAAMPERRADFYYKRIR
jgi:hypothetical protein